MKREIEVSDILAMELSHDEKLKLLKLWLTTEVGLFIDKPKPKPEFQWWQFRERWKQFCNRPTRYVET